MSLYNSKHKKKNKVLRKIKIYIKKKSKLSNFNTSFGTFLYLIQINKLFSNLRLFITFAPLILLSILQNIQIAVIFFGINALFSNIFITFIHKLKISYIYCLEEKEVIKKFLCLISTITLSGIFIILGNKFGNILLKEIKNY